jgi:ABC-type transport system involved in cytochrome bd biosynthesis fused ATPase/permease subunit
MGWELRNGKRVYYQKYRFEGRVVSYYVGSDAWATHLAQLEQSVRAALKRQQQRLRAQQAQDKQLDQHFDELERMVYALAHATLLAEGFHTHKGQWRKRREPHQKR